MASNSCFKLQRAHIIDSKGAAIPRGIRIANTDRRRQFPVARANGSDENGILSSLFKSNPFDAIKEGTINLRVGGGGAQSKQSKNQSGFKGKDPMTVFVAGSSGRLGIRVVYELAAAGYKVRAGVRSQDKADAFDDELDDLCSRIGELDRRARSQINLVYCDLQDEESILPAIGNASRVVCAVGAAESEFTNLAAPKLIDYQATETLISIASSCNISQFILVTSLGTGKIGFPAGVLNLFGGILIWKRKAEEALEQSGMPYLIVRPGGMERPKDNHKEKFNVRLSTRDTLFGGTVSRLQVAELITAAVMDPEVAMNKCVEVVAETEAPLTEYGALLDTMPVEISQDAREQALVTYGALIAQEREVNASIDSLSAELADTRDTIAGLQVALKDARDELKETMKENGQILKEAERIEFEVATLKAEVEEKKLLALAAKTVAQAQQRGLGSGTVLSREEITSIRDSILYPPVEEEEEEEEEEVSSKPASQPFFAFGNKPAPMESEMVEEEKSVENSTATSKPVKQDSGLLGSLIGFLEGDGRRVDSDPVQDSETPAADVPEEEPVAEQKVDEKKENDIFASFKNMFGGQEAVFIDDLEQQAEVTKEPKQNVAVEEDAKEQVVVVEEETVAMNEEASAVVVEEETIAATEEKAKSLFPDIGSLIKPISFPESTEAKPAAATSDMVTAIQNNAGSNAAEAREWINAWRNRTSENVPDNVAQARDWIAAWKQRT